MLILCDLHPFGLVIFPSSPKSATATLSFFSLFWRRKAKFKDKVPAVLLVLSFSLLTLGEIMSRSGELALKRLIISYSPTLQSSRNTRQFLATHLPAFQAKYPSVHISIRPRQWPERGITGIFRDGSERFYNTAGLSTMGMFIRCHKLANECNDYDLPFSAAHLHFQRKTVQGAWNPWLWMAERPYSRKQPAAWNRRLTEDEWSYYVDKFSSQMKLENEAVQHEVAKHTELPHAYSQDAAAKWKRYVVPKLQTDIEHNLASFKADFKKGVKPAAVSMGAYRLFSAPNVTELGQDAVTALRGREIERMDSWWLQRKQQLKPPK